METPAIDSETGNSSTFASFADPPAPTQPDEFSMSYLNGGKGSCDFFSDCAGSVDAFGRDPEASPAAARGPAVIKSLRLSLNPYFLAVFFFTKPPESS